MRRLSLSVVLCSLFLGQLMAQDPVVMTVAGIPVLRSEFEYSYNKNNGDGVIDKKSVDEYVDLYVNYKLKLKAALDARLDTMSSFKKEFAMYRDQQVRPSFVTDDDVVSEAYKLYQRMKEEIGPRGLLRPAHIFMMVDTKASSAEQERIRMRIDSVYRALRAGADFETLAKKVSQDPGSARNGGLLPWIGPNQVYKEFEDVAYSLQKGQYSQPFLTPIGYHIVLMKDRKQVEPFDSLKDVIVRSIEQQGIRDRIIQDKLNQQVTASQGTRTQEQVLQQRADELSSRDQSLKYLIQEYHDGLLVYEISNRMVWDLAAKDEEGQRDWFLEHKKQYKWDTPRYKGIAYHVKDKQDVKAVKKCVKRLPFEQWNEALRNTFNPDTIIRIRVEKGLFKPGDNATVDRMVFKIPAEVKGLKDYPIDAVYGKKLKKPKEYTDVKAEVIEDYQEYLEKEWVSALRRRYPFTVNTEVLQTVNRH